MRYAMHLPAPSTKNTKNTHKRRVHSLNMDQLKQLPNRTVVTSFTTPSSSSSSSSPNIVSSTDFDEGHYVLHVASGPQSPSTTSTTPHNHHHHHQPTQPTTTTKPNPYAYVSCSLTNHNIITYDTKTLQQVHSIQQAHDDRITDLCHVGSHPMPMPPQGDGHAAVQHAPFMIGSSGYDGTVKLFDIRTGTGSKGHPTQPSIQINLPRKDPATSISFGYGGALAAVGGAKGCIYFYDLRQGGGGGGANGGNGTQVSNQHQPLGTYANSHTDEVTKLRFQPGSEGGYDTTSLLLSGSEDGLACIFDTSQPSEEKALKSVMNVSSPLRQVGFFGPALEGVYCLTGSESISVWHHDSAQRIYDFGTNVRSTLSSLTGGGGGSGGGIPIQYLVNCHWDGRELNLLAGNSDGVSALFRVDAGALSFKKQLNGGHRGCIRDYAVLNNGTGDCIITGGEDARMCEWTFGNGGIAPDKSSRKETTSSTDTRTGATGEERYSNTGGGKMKRSKNKKGHVPYRY